MDLIVTCTCGHKTTVSEFAAGMTAPCPGCGKPLTVGPDNAKPVTAAQSPAIAAPQPSRHTDLDNIVYTPMQVSSLKTHCARCGKEFRGDWDRHQSAAGLVCNICKNFVSGQAQDVASTGYVAPVDTMKLDPDYDPITREPVEVEEIKEPWYRQYIPDQEMKRRIAIGLAVAFGLYTLYLFISGAWVVAPAPEGSGATAAVAEAPKELPMWAKFIAQGLFAASGFVGTFAGLCVFLTLSRRLPEEGVVANFIRLLPTAALLTAVLFATSYLPFGGVLALIFVPLIVFVSLGFETQDIINLPLGMFLGGALTGMIFILLRGILAAIAL